MFSGIVEAVGRISRLQKRASGGRLDVRLPASFGSVRTGESILVSGVCLTAISPGRILRSDLSEETLARTTFRDLEAGDRVNLERALRLSDRLSGHLVQGHVDAVVRMMSVSTREGSWIYSFSMPARLSAYIVEKGSVALDGISLTVAGFGRRSFRVAVVPYTYRATSLREKSRGDGVNFEADVLAKYVEALMRRR